MTHPGSADALRKALEEIAAMDKHSGASLRQRAASEVARKALSADAALSASSQFDGDEKPHDKLTLENLDWLDLWLSNYPPSNQHTLMRQAFTAARAALSQQGVVETGREISRKPPAHWKPDARYARMLPMTDEEWDWEKDGPDNDPEKRSKKRLEFAACQMDPRAPDQMALVLRIDLLRILGDHTHKNAYWEMHRAKAEPAAPQAQVMGEALATGTSGLDATAEKCPHGVPGAIWCRTCTPYEPPEPRRG